MRFSCFTWRFFVPAIFLFSFTLFVRSSSLKGEEIQRYLEQLKDASFIKRKEATLALWGEGPSLLPILTPILDSPHPEVRYRVQLLHQRISAGILPETPLNLHPLIESFHSSSLDKKLSVIKTLQKADLHQQVIHLLFLRPIKYTSPQLTIYANKSLAQVIQSYRSQNQSEAALSFLRRYQERSSLIHPFLGHLLNQKGLLRQEIQNTSDPQAKLIYASILQDIPLLKKLALEHNHTPTLITLALLQGDLTPFLESRIQTLSPQESLAEAPYQLAQYVLQGDQQASEQLITKLLKRLKKRPQNHALKALFSNGYFSEALQSMQKNYLLERLFFLEISGDWESFLAPLGLEVEERPDAKWIQSYSNRVIEQFKKENDPKIIHYYLNYASFLQKHQEIELSASLLHPLLVYFTQDSSIQHLEKIFEVLAPYQLFPSILHPLNQKLFNDLATTESFFLSTFGFANSYPFLSTSLAALYPDKKPTQRIQILATALGIIPDSQDLSSQFHQDYLAYLSSLPDEQHHLHYQFLYEAALKKNHRALALTYNEHLIQVAQRQHATAAVDSPKQASFMRSLHHQLFTRISLLFYQGHWQEARTLINAHPDLKRYHFPFSLRNIVCLARLGKMAEAQKSLQQLLAQIQGHSELKIALNFLSEHAPSELCLPLIQRVLLQSNPQHLDYHQAVQHLYTYAEDQEDWQLATSAARFLSLNLIETHHLNELHLLQSWQFNHDANCYLALRYVQQGKNEQALRLFKTINDQTPHKSYLAEKLLPFLRRTGHLQELNNAFNQSLQSEKAHLQHYPHSTRIKNRIAWLCSRSKLQLDQADTYIRQALDIDSLNPSYLHTMAEVQAAKNNHSVALEWAKKALIHSSPFDAQMRDEYERFKNGSP